MTYYILRKYCQFILKLFTKKIDVSGLENLPKNGAVLLASNHPNSFLDAIVINCIVPRPVWSLARGDAFKKPLIKAFLSKIFMMPIYRISEGREYLGKNDETFQKCYKIFKNGGQVLIFSEGLCSNQTTLLPLKKGTGRLTLQTWQSNLDLKIVPVGINYDHYFKFGKTIQLNFGETLSQSNFEAFEHEGQFLKSFNEVLKSKLEPLFNRQFTKSIKPNIVLYYLGWVINFPLYLFLNGFVKNKTKGTVFFDSAFYGFLIIGIPIYWLLLWVIYSILF
jgi:1-acyl-sn-glycerol-3-phosphate acyltransferase